MDTTLKTIACVEDDPDIQTIIEAGLTEVGDFEIVVYGSGAQALDGIATVNPDLVLLDVMMPRMDGIETLRRLKENPQTADIPVIFMTAKAQRHELERYRQLGVIATITKPFEVMSLADDVKSIWQDWKAPSNTA